jgi:hypothetical protein
MLTDTSLYGRNRNHARKFFPLNPAAATRGLRRVFRKALYRLQGSWDAEICLIGGFVSRAAKFWAVFLFLACIYGIHLPASC